MDVLTVVIPWLKVLYPLFACIIIKLEQSFTDWNPEAAITMKNLLGQHDQTIEFFCFILYIDSDFLCSDTHSFIAVKHIGVVEPGTQLKILSQLCFFSTACLTLWER